MHAPGSVCSPAPQIICMDIGHAPKDNFAPEDLSSVALCDAFRYELVFVFTQPGTSSF